jgi:CHAT domain-containing protein
VLSFGFFLAFLIPSIGSGPAFGQNTAPPNNAELVKRFKDLTSLIQSTQDLTPSIFYQRASQISLETGSFLKIIVRSDFPDDLMRKVVIKIFDLVLKHELPVDFTQQGQAFQILLEPRHGKNEDEAYDIFEEFTALLSIYHLAGRSGPLSRNELYRKLRNKLIACGSFAGCSMGMHLLELAIAKEELWAGNYDESRAAVRGSLEHLFKHKFNFKFGRKFQDSYARVVMSLTELNIMKERLELKSAYTMTKAIQRELETVFYQFAKTEKNLNYFRIAWQTEVNLLEWLLELGKHDEVKDLATKRLNLFLAISSDSQSRKSLENEKVKQQLVGFTKSTKGSDKELDLGSLFKLVVKENFDEDDRKKALSEIVRFVNKYQHQIFLGDMAPSEGIFPLFQGLTKLAEERPRRLTDAVKHIDKFFGTHLPTIAFSSFLVSESLSSRFALSSLMVNYDSIGAKPRDSSKSFFLKLYANGLQEIRQQFDSSSIEIFDAFLALHKENLQDGAEFFFRSGDYLSGEQLIRIIKENELGGFLSTKSVPLAAPQALVGLTEYERGVLRSLDSLRVEYLALMRLFRGLPGGYQSAQKQQVAIAMSEIERKFKIRFLSLLEESRVIRRDAPSKTAPHLRSDKPTLIALVQNERVLVTLLEGSRVQQIIIDLRKEQLREAAFHLLIPVSQRLTGWEAAHRNFDRLVVKPIRESIGFFRSKEIYFIGDDILSVVQHTFFELGAEYRIVANATISGLPSTSKAAQEGIDAFATTRGAHGFAPLPAAKEEAHFVAGFPFRGIRKDAQRSAHIDQNFSRSSFTRSLGQNRLIVHVATHFQLTGKRDRDSKLLLGDGSLLTLEELLSSELRTGNIHLLTLSACQTALSGESLSASSSVFESVAGAFSRLGVNNVIGTLWEIGDQSTFDFMKIFYTFLLDKSSSVSAALEQTKLVFKGVDANRMAELQKAYPSIFDASMRERLNGYRHPYYWGGFTLFTRQ